MKDRSNRRAGVLLVRMTQVKDGGIFRIKGFGEVDEMDKRGNMTQKTPCDEKMLG